MDNDPVAYVVLRGEDESTSCVLYQEDVVLLRKAVDRYSSEGLAETKERLRRLFERFGWI